MPRQSKHIVLFLAANPRGTERLALDQEANAIQQQLDASGSSRRYEFKTVHNAAPRELLRELRELKPTVVHISCHGRGPVSTAAAGDHAYRDVRAAEWTPGLYLQGSDGRAQFVSATTLRRTFGAAGRSVKLVVFNACYSKPLARGLLRHVDCVVGMNGSILDDAARCFATELYRCLARGGSVEGAVRVGRLAIELLGLPGRDLPRLRVRKGVVADELVLRPDPVARRFLNVVAARLRLGSYLAGIPGIALAGVMLVVTALIAYRMWFALGESSLAARAQWLAVDALSAPEPVQGNRDVRAVIAPESTIEGAPVPANAFGIPHRIALTGAFNTLEFGRGDPACRWIFDAGDGGVSVTRATAKAQACPQDLVLRAGPSGLELQLDDGPPIPLRPHDRLVLHSPSGKPIILVPQRDQIVLFRPATDVVWPIARLRAVAPAGEHITLPGNWRRSDVFELAGTVELRELMLGRGGLTVGGSLRNWSGSIGRPGDWDSAAPWPRSQYCVVLAVVLLAMAIGLGTYLLYRQKNWGKESE